MYILIVKGMGLDFTTLYQPVFYQKVQRTDYILENIS